jgi:uncharacterized membrane protein HdeD (DUF308 family)
MSVAVGDAEAVEVTPGFAKHWWVFLVSGVLWFLISLVVLRFTRVSITTVGVILGVVFLVGAVNEVMTASFTPAWRWVHILMAVLLGLGAIWAFAQPKEAFWALASVLGFLFVFKGTLDIVVATATKSINDLWWLGLVAGILEVLLGFWASQQFYPARAALILLWVGFGAMFRGIGEIVMAFRVRSLRS